MAATKNQKCSNEPVLPRDESLTEIQEAENPNSPQANVSSASNGRKPHSKGSGCSCFFSFLAILFALIAIYIGYLVFEFPTLNVDVTYPESVVSGDEFVVVIKTWNPHESTTTLHSIHIDDSFLAGFQLIDSKPEFNDTMHANIVAQRQWSYYLPVKEKAEATITLKFRAVMAGHFSGDLDVCNWHQDFRSVALDILVKDPSDEDAKKSK